MISVISSKTEPHHLQQLREWFIAEWGHIDPFEDYKDGFIVPSPLLVIDGQKLLGGLVFTRYQIPGNKKMGLWINAVYVKPEHRGIGIGSQLIQTAEVEAANIKEKELFASTDVPAIYQNLGWLHVDSSGEDKVLKKVVEITIGHT